MALIFIYGPPATGKLTVAKELAKLTKYRIFHNHMTVDLVRSIFDMHSKAFVRLIDLYRLEMFEEAAREHLGLIFTFVYAKPDDDYFIKETIQRVQKHGEKVCFVQLYCQEEALSRRVKHPSRGEFDKIRSKAKLYRMLKKYELFLKVPYKRSLSIDNTNISPRKVAQRIKSYYKL